MRVVKDLSARGKQHTCAWLRGALRSHHKYIHIYIYIHHMYKIVYIYIYTSYLIIYIYMYIYTYHVYIYIYHICIYHTTTVYII
jgi:hypothetical protein